MSIADEPKIDCHLHVFDPAAFPYTADTFYAPSGQEIGTPDQLLAVLDAYGVERALLVGPNSGYDTGNSCLLELIGRAPDRFAGMAVVSQEAPIEDLRKLQVAGVIEGPDRSNHALLRLRSAAGFGNAREFRAVMPPTRRRPECWCFAGLVWAVLSRQAFKFRPVADLVRLATNPRRLHLTGVIIGKMRTTASAAAAVLFHGATCTHDDPPAVSMRQLHRLFGDEALQLEIHAWIGTGGPDGEQLYCVADLLERRLARDQKLADRARAVVGRGAAASESLAVLERHFHHAGYEGAATWCRNAAAVLIPRPRYGRA